MPALNLAEIEALWILNGGNPQKAPQAASIAMAESGGNTAAINHNTNGTIDRGLFQINSVHGSLSTTDLVANVKAAIALSGNGQNWGAWTTFKTGAYQKFMQQAQGLLTAVQKDVANAKSTGSSDPGLGIPGLDQAAGALEGTFNAAAGAVQTVGNTANAIGSIATLLTSSAFWIRLGEALAGILLLAMGLRSLTGSTATPVTVAAAAARKVVK